MCSQYQIKKVRKCVKRWRFLIPDLRTHENIRKQIKNHQNSGLLSWHGAPHNLQIDFIHDLLLFGKDTKAFLRAYLQ